VNIGRRDTGTEYARTFGGGGRDLTRAVAAEFKVSLEDAQAWKENEGDVTLDGANPEQERAAAALLRALSPLLREVRSTLRAHNARFHRNVERIHLCGGTAKLRGLPELLSRELSVPVQLLDTLPPEAVSALPSGTSPVTCQAFALAMRGHGSSRAARFNLRKGEFAFKGDLDYLKGKVSRLVAFAAVLVLLSGTLVWAQLRNLEGREKSLDRMLCDTTQRVVGQCQKDYLVALSLLKGKGSPVSLIPAYSALDLFAELTSRAEKHAVKLDEVEVQMERIRVRGETESFDGVDQLVLALKGFRCFQEIKRGKVQKNREGTKVQFDLDVHVQCPETARGEG
jgi:general secretion pathway protein L